jgi:hypothetical protein
MKYKGLVIVASVFLISAVGQMATMPAIGPNNGGILSSTLPIDIFYFFTIAGSVSFPILVVVGLFYLYKVLRANPLDWSVHYGSSADSHRNSTRAHGWDSGDHWADWFNNWQANTIWGRTDPHSPYNPTPYKDRFKDDPLYGSSDTS